MADEQIIAQPELSALKEEAMNSLSSDSVETEAEEIAAGDSLDEFTSNNDTLELTERDEVLNALDEPELEAEEPELEAEEPEVKDSNSKIISKIKKYESENVKLKQEIKEYEQYPQQLGQQLKDYAQSNPVEFLQTFFPDNLNDVIIKALGNMEFTGQDIVDDDLSPETAHSRELEQKLQTIEQKLAQRDEQDRLSKEQAEKQSYNAEMKQTFDEIDSAINETNTPLLVKFKSQPTAMFPNGIHNQIFETAKLYYNNTGNVPSFEETAKVVEQIVKEDLERLNISPEVSTSEISQPVPSKSSPTLMTSYGNSASKPTTQMSLEELKEQALRSIS